MRDLLFLSHRIPFPPDKGDKIRSYHILRYLASRFRIHLGCFFDDAADERHIAALRAICAETFCIPLSQSRKALLGLRGALLGKSVSETIYQNPRMAEWVRLTLTAHDIKDIFVFCSAMSPYVLGYGRGRRLVIDMVDVDSEKWGDYAQSARWPFSAFYRTEQHRVRALERRAADVCDSALFVSRMEADTFLKIAPGVCGRVGYLENGVDTDRLDPAQTYADPFRAGSFPIVFTGAMNYRPNVDAAIWFAREMFPAVRAACARAEFWIVGSNPAAAIRHLARHPGIRVTGAVPDVRPYLANARCAVAPMRIARGVQNKVLEAMAMARPVVLTPAALEGLNAIPGQEVILASNSEDFARRVSEILSGTASLTGAAARERVARDHCWSRNLAPLDLLFDERIERPVSRSANASSRARSKAALP